MSASSLSSISFPAEKAFTFQVGLGLGLGLGLGILPSHEGGHLLHMPLPLSLERLESRLGLGLNIHLP